MPVFVRRAIAVTGNESQSVDFSIGTNDLGFMMIVVFGIGCCAGVQFFLCLYIFVAVVLFMVTMAFTHPEYEGLSEAADCDRPELQKNDTMMECHSVPPDMLLMLEVSAYVIAGMMTFMYAMRSLELQERRDFRLTKRLAAENIHVQMEMSSMDWFSKGAAEVAPSGGGGGHQPGIAKYMIKAADVEERQVLGAGSFGEVKAGKWRGTDVAIKKLKGEIEANVMIEFGSEAAIMAELRHPSIVMFLGFCPLPPMILMEYMPRGSMHKVLYTDRTELDWSLRLRCLMDAARGMNFLHLHSPPVIHSDLKSLNLLVDQARRARARALRPPRREDESACPHMRARSAGLALQGVRLWALEAQALSAGERGRGHVRGEDGCRGARDGDRQ